MRAVYRTLFTLLLGVIGRLCSVTGLFLDTCTILLQSNLDSPNTDGLVTVDNSNSFLSSCEILKIDQENKYLGKFSHVILGNFLILS